VLRYTDITGKEIDKVKTAIERLKAFEPKDGYYLAFSGGKDSCCIKALADMSGVKYDAHYNATTIDPPELVRFIMAKHPDVVFERPALPMRKLIVERGMMPTRMRRYCCHVLKEGGGKGRIVVTGVRWAESNRRRAQHGVARVGERKDRKVFIMNDDNDDSRRMVEQCYRTQKTMVNPIVDWLDEDVWEFIRTEKLPYCCLYDEGKKRIGCIGCPMASIVEREADFKRWPQYERMYRTAIAEMLDVRKAKGKVIKPGLDTADGVFDRWMERTRPMDENQTMMDMDDDNDAIV
jgi:phosphoadenosine phosphosulfate reductase